MTKAELIRDLTKVHCSKSETGRLIDEYVEIIQARPMGVSNWINHGKKYGYFEYYKNN